MTSGKDVVTWPWVNMTHSSLLVYFSNYFFQIQTKYSPLAIMNSSLWCAFLAKYWARFGPILGQSLLSSYLPQICTRDSPLANINEHQLIIMTFDLQYAFMAQYWTLSGSTMSSGSCNIVFSIHLRLEDPLDFSTCNFSTFL